MAEKSTEEYALENGLFRVGAKQPLTQYIAETVERLQFAYTLAAFSNEAGNAKSRIGGWWNLLIPTMQAASYGLIFGVIMGRQRPDNFLPFLFTGVFLFSFIQGCFTGGASSIVNRTGLVRTLNFPRVLLPLSIVISQVLSLFPQLLVLSVILVIVQGIGTISLNWLMLIPLIAMMSLFSFGLAMIMARVTVHVQDLNKLIPFISRILFYSSGVFFAVEKILNSDNVFAKVITANPIFQFLNLARGYLVEGYHADPAEWISVSLWTVGLVVFGFIFFWGAEERYGRED